ncbi:MAG: hypothetical protein ACPGXI_06765 [Mycobacterium sp.]
MALDSGEERPDSEPESAESEPVALEPVALEPVALEPVALEPVESANATDGIDAIAAPTPRATAHAPTRPA